MFLFRERLNLRVRVFYARAYFLFARFFVLLFGVHPRRRQGGAGGPAAPVGGGQGELCSPCVDVCMNVVSLGCMLFPPALAGGSFRGGQPVVLLDIYRLTDTRGGNFGFCCGL